MNIALRISELAKTQPEKPSTIFPKKTNYIGVPKYKYTNINFRKIDELSSQYANGLVQSGLKPGDKTLLFVKPCLEFHALVFGLFKAGVVPVLIDPGMGKENLLKAIADSQPKAIIAEPIVHLMKWFYSKSFTSIKVSVSTKNIPFIGLKSFRSWENLSTEFKTFEAKENDLAAILFTSGGTGRPKGVEYTHSIFDQQTSILQEMFSLSNKDVDLPGFPLFSLFTLAMGMSSCVPDMNPSKPADCSPQRLIQNIKDNKATFLAGSPAIWTRVADYCTNHNITLPSVRVLSMFGAPVANSVHEQFKDILINGTTYTPYGATESLPVSNVSGKFVLEQTARKTNSGSGTCVGKAAPHMQIKIIPITDDLINDISETPVLSAKIKGEIIVKGGVVTKAYHKANNSTQLAKIKDGDGFWHRMGDIGYLDNDDNLWFCGRKSHRVETDDELLLPAPCEGIFNNHPSVDRSALIGLGKPGEQIPAIVILADETKLIRTDELSEELKEFATRFPTTKNIQKFFFIDKLPVDVRHNIKIDRLLLKDKAEKGLL